MDDVTWGALTLTLMLMGGIWTWLAYRRRGLPAALKGAGLTLLPLAAYLTETLRMLTRILGAVADWATSLVFSPVVWLGVITAGVAVVLVGTGRALERRGVGKPGAETRGAGDQRRPRDLPSAATSTQERRGQPAIDDDLAEIEALLRRRGIT